MFFHESVFFGAYFRKKRHKKLILKNVWPFLLSNAINVPFMSMRLSSNKNTSLEVVFNFWSFKIVISVNWTDVNAVPQAVEILAYQCILKTRQVQRVRLFDSTSFLPRVLVMIFACMCVRVSWILQSFVATVWHLQQSASDQTRAIPPRAT